MTLIMRMIPQPVGSITPVDRANKVAYGEHLTKIAGCQFCHTPFEKGQPVKEKFLAGGQEFLLAPNARAVSINLTPEPNTGIGTMTEEQFLEKFYQYKDYSANGSPVIEPVLNTEMPWLHLSRMEPEDLKAIFAYLRTAMASARRCASALNSSCWIALACRVASGASSAGRSAADGIAAPCTSRGMTRVPRCNAVWTSRRTKSALSSMRRDPSGFVTVSHFRPMTIITTAVLPSARSSSTTKSVPGTIVSMSMKTACGPNRRVR
jgi:hypothetical protein